MPNAFQCAFRQGNAFQELCGPAVRGCFVIIGDLGLTVAVADGSVTLLVLVSGGLLEPYQVKASPSWATDVIVTSKDDTGFLLIFTVAAPPDGSVDLTIVQDPFGERCR